ncbi:aldo/keto reductase [Kitasatospora sp. NPDC101176]|uniref:aldo/keto reductase n=1 Tax=Kitasatospora sp. NPDC101176 TaxID=3364099 RepID=UPI0037FB534F
MLVPEIPAKASQTPAARRLGRTGPHLPCVGLGTWRRFDLPAGREHLAREIVALALAHGVRVFDTAPVYGRSEEVLARALGAARQQAFVATKIWADGPARGRRQFENQLRLFDGRVDLLQLHHVIGWRNHTDWLQQERERGRIGRIGLTYWRDHAFGGGTAADLEQAMRTGVYDTVQIPLNPRERAVEQRILPLARELGIGVLVMRPFAEGGLLNRTPDPRRLAAAAGCTDASEALLRWGLSDERVHVTLPATLDPAHLLANVAAGAAPPLTADQRTALAELFV